MNDTAPSTSLSVRAKRLTALARAKRDDIDASQAQGQVQTALNRLDQELRTLDGVFRVHRKLKELGVPVADAGDLEQPVKRLKEQAALGRPTAQFLNARVKDVVGIHTNVDAANVEAWRTWAGQQIEELPTALVPRVPFYKRNETTTRIANLQKLAAGKPIIDEIIQFKNSYGRVKEELDAVEGASIDSVLERFINSRILLADLSDAELEMLRGDASLSDQLYLHLGS